MYADHPDAGKYFRDVLGVLDEQHPDFNVALHAWKEASVWDYDDQSYQGVLEHYITSAPNAGLVGTDFLESMFISDPLADVSPIELDLRGKTNDAIDRDLVDLPTGGEFLELTNKTGPLEAEVPEPTSGALLIASVWIACVIRWRKPASRSTVL